MFDGANDNQPGLFDWNPRRPQADGDREWAARRAQRLRLEAFLKWALAQYFGMTTGDARKIAEAWLREEGERATQERLF
jgi:hypothetical protein